MFSDTVKGEFLERPNRFAAVVQVKGEPVRCFMPNPGRMHELLVPGAKLLLRPADNPARKTPYTVVAAWHDGRLVSLDSHLPNRLVGEALRKGAIPEFEGYNDIRPEFTHGRSRFDFLLKGNGPDCLLEVKSCTLVEDGVSKFPDAPTTRGARHVRHLADALDEGYRCAVMVVIQRDDALSFTPNTRTDPDFSRALKEAHEKGVEVYAYRCRVDMDGVELDSPIPVLLD